MHAVNALTDEAKPAQIKRLHEALCLIHKV